MNLLGKLKSLLNCLLKPANVKIDSLTAARREQSRLQALQIRGHVKRAIFPVLENIHQPSVTAIVKQVAASADRFKLFYNASDNPVGYAFANNYYTSPDTEVLYAVIQHFRPARIIEVGCGNSTRIARQAITDVGLPAELIAIDPFPRCEVSGFADRVVTQNVETIEDQSLFTSLQANDILFIDSSHEVKCGNDVLLLLLNVMPGLKPGVLVHLHDIFLPFEYPEEWIVKNGWPWNEQYLVQALLAGGKNFEILWAGHYFQRCNPDFKNWFAHWRGADAKSLWLRKL